MANPDEPGAPARFDPLGPDAVAEPVTPLAGVLADNPPTGGVKRTAGEGVGACMVAGAFDPGATLGVPPVVAAPVPPGVDGEPDGPVGDELGVPRSAQRGITCWARLVMIACASLALRAVMPDFTCER